MEVLVPALVALVLGKPIIGALAKLNIRQTIYAYAPDTHRAKEGTPTMGGFIMLFAVAGGLLALIPSVQAAPALLHIRHFPVALSPFALLFSTALLFALLGFVDDYLVRRWLGRRGLEWKVKLLLQFLAAGIALYAIADIPPQLLRGELLPQPPSLPSVMWVFGLVWVVAWVNAFNLTDGLDGLAAGLSVIAFGVLAAIGRDALSIITAMLWCGAALGYLWWNLHPARVFMGDTGSMALGATFGLITWREIALAQSVGQAGRWAPVEWMALCVLIGLVFALEMVSVVFQLSAVKLLKRRLFRATPIHHHFELLGWQESEIVGRFWLVGALAGLTAYTLSGGMP
ncbi:Phospho-N-acetylmuramoyl-pentapeptide-transferase [bacterium HR15]|nr:Phospho-N-acetylmuramoyl-pentapeptide-transferase [bacterium HR15]